MVYPDLCLGFLTRNQSFCRKNKQKCHSVHAGLGDFTLGEDSLALAKSSGSAFFDPVIPGETLKGDLQSALLSKKMTVSDWSRMCSQVKALEPPVSCNDLAGEQAYSQKTKDYLQTPRKPKSEPTEFDFRQEDDEDDEEDDPFEQVDTFVKSDPLGGLSEDKRLDFVEDYLSKSSEEAVKLARKTGLLIKTASTGQAFHSTAINEITNNMGLKSSNFPEQFDCASIWSPLEALGNAGQEDKADIKALVSKALKSERGARMTNLTSSMNGLFVKDEAWSKFLIKIGACIKRE